MKVVLVICYRSNLSYLQRHFEGSISYTLTFALIEAIIPRGINHFIKDIIHRVRSGALFFDGVTALCDLGILIASLIAQELGFSGPSYRSLLVACHKYEARVVQQLLLPSYTPQFALVDSALEGFFNRCHFPLIVKPVRSSLSYGAYKVESKNDFFLKLDSAKKCAALQADLYQSVIFPHMCSLDEVLVEEFVFGDLVTLDGYVYDKKIHLLGMTQSHMIPGTLSFVRFDHPVHFNNVIFSLLEEIVSVLISAYGLDFTFFNIEFVVTLDQKVKIIECNPRISLQFCSLIEDVTGYNPLDGLCDIAVGVKPDTKKRKESISLHSSSCVLRKNKDHRVVKMPSKKELERLEQQYKNIRIIPLADEGKKLSDFRQDSYTFRYALIDIPGMSLQEILDIRDAVAQELSYVLEPLKDISL